ncbi:hypothetical protein HY572_06715 [Candidatus Micrarchaeota archaeon]|nr:hypothetical protein [Candidatus Micrarchaeota archaeon]
MMRKIKEWGYQVYHGKFPPGAIRFQYNVSLGQELTEENRREIQGIKERFDLTDVYVGHGTTIQRNGSAHAILGPPGIGKTRLLKNLEKTGALTGLDDGLIVLGKMRDGRMVTITTGTLRTNLRKAFVEQKLRGMADYKSPYLGEPSGRELTTRLKKDAIIARIAQLASLFLWKDRKPFEPQAIELGNGVYVQHPKNPFAFRHVNESGQTRKLNQEEIEEVFGTHLQSIPSQPGWHHEAAGRINATPVT